MPAYHDGALTGLHHGHFERNLFGYLFQYLAAHHSFHRHPHLTLLATFLTSFGINFSLLQHTGGHHLNPPLNHLGFEGGYRAFFLPPLNVQILSHDAKFGSA